MKQKQLVSILLIIVPLVGYLEAQERENSNNKNNLPASCHLRELELCSIGAASMIQNPNGLPTNQAEMTRQCELLQESSDCFDAYKDNCMTKLQSNLIGFFSRDLLQFKDELCNNGTDLNRMYMKHSACFRQVQKKYQRTCMSDLQVGFENIHKMNRFDRLALTCCNVDRLRSCILPKIEEKCGKEALDFVDSLIRRAVGRVMDMTCRNYDSNTDKCRSLLPKSGTKPNNSRSTSALSRVISSYSHTM